MAGAVVLAVGLTGCVAAPPHDPSPTVTVTVTPQPTGGTDEASGQFDPGESSAFAKQSTCALGEAGIALLVAGGTAAQAFASLLVENVDDGRIRELAMRVRDGSDTADIRAELSERLTAYCAVR